MLLEKTVEVRFSDGFYVFDCIARSVDENEGRLECRTDTAPAHDFLGVFDGTNHAVRQIRFPIPAPDEKFPLVTKQLKPSLVCENHAIPFPRRPVAVPLRKV